MPLEAGTGGGCVVEDAGLLKVRTHQPRSVCEGLGP